ncbi:hypothetical protein KIW84_UN0852 [Lathyrus oleraceus]|nr:hypothetical protein KIW84_UN0852 [Pisum sativum]
MTLLILASDGLWDKVSNQEAVDIACQFCVGNNEQRPLLACKKLAELSASRGSLDDTSAPPYYVVVPPEEEARYCLLCILTSSF